MPATSYAHELMLEALINKTEIPLFANTYAGFTTADPTSAGLMTTEIFASEYQRQPMSFGAYTPPMSNTTEALWTPDGTWTAIGYAFIADSSQGGNMLFYDDVEELTTPTLGHVLKIPIGYFTIT